MKHRTYEMVAGRFREYTGRDHSEVECTYEAVEGMKITKYAQKFYPETAWTWEDVWTHFVAGAKNKYATLIRESRY